MIRITDKLIKRVTINFMVTKYASGKRSLMENKIISWKNSDSYNLIFFSH